MKALSATAPDDFGQPAPAGRGASQGRQRAWQPELSERRRPRRRAGRDAAVGRGLRTGVGARIPTTRCSSATWPWRAATSQTFSLRWDGARRRWPKQGSALETYEAQVREDPDQRGGTQRSRDRLLQAGRDARCRRPHARGAGAARTGRGAAGSAGRRRSRQHAGAGRDRHQPRLARAAAGEAGTAGGCDSEPRTRARHLPRAEPRQPRQRRAARGGRPGAHRACRRVGGAEPPGWTSAGRIALAPSATTPRPSQSSSRSGTRARSRAPTSTPSTRRGRSSTTCAPAADGSATSVVPPEAAGAMPAGPGCQPLPPHE